MPGSQAESSQITSELQLWLAAVSLFDSEGSIYFFVRSSLLLGIDLVEKVHSLLDLVLELEEVSKVAADLLKRKIDEHTSDLWSLLLTNELLDELIDELTDELLEVGVARDDSRNELVALLVVAVDEGIRVSERTFRALDEDLGWSNLSNWHRWLDDILHGLLRWELAWCLVVLLASTMRMSTSVLALVTLGSSVLEVSSHVASLHGASVEVLVGEAVSAHLSLHEREDLLDELDGVGASEKLGVKWAGILFFEVHEISLVLCLSLLLLTDLGELVVGHVEKLSIDSLGVESCASSSCAVG